jgi:hypothetical protein
MIWMSWRQQRAGVLAALGALAVVGAVLAVTGVHLSHLYDTYRSCSGFTCGSAFSAVDTSYPHVRLIGPLLMIAPALAGVFWGAPLVAREVESGTFRLAWVQGVSRGRWLTCRLVVAGAATATLVGALTAAFGWWAIPIDRIEHNRIDPAVFGQRGFVPVAYALFAFALGVALGTMIRRTLAAMALTLVGFTVVRLITQIFVRPHLMTPVKKVISLADQVGLGIERSPAGLNLVPGEGPHLPGAWVIDKQIVDSAGQGPTTAIVNHACSSLLAHTPVPGGPGSGGGKGTMRPIDGPALQAMHDCLAHLSTRFHEVVSYQPGSRFWALQSLESAIFLGAAAVLLALTAYWVRHRLA